MHRLSFHDAFHAGRQVRLLTIGALAVLVCACMSRRNCLGADCRERDPAIRPEFREPVTLASKEGVLEVRLTARQGQATLDTVATPVQNFLLFDYEVIRGTASDGQTIGRQSLSGADSAGVSRRNADRPFRERPHRPDHPGLLQSAVHAEGQIRSDLSGADDLLAAQSPHPRSSISVRREMPTTCCCTSLQGCPTPTPTTFPGTCRRELYWYHSHLHGLTAAQVYTGLVGLLAVGRTDGNLPLVTEKSIPIRNMALQYNFVFDRAGGLAQLNNLTWPQWVSTIIPPKPGELANGTYPPSLAPVNFNQSKPGTKYLTVWYAGPLSIHNRRGSLQFIPSNLQHFAAAGGKADERCAGGSIAAGLQAGCAIHGQWPVSAGHQEQGWPDRDLGARECERLCLHERPAHGNRDRATSADRHRRPGWKSLYRPSTIRRRTTARGCSFRRRAGSRLR